MSNMAVPNIAESHFATLDWAVLGIYLLLLVTTGFLFTRKQHTTDDYFRAGNHMPVWAVAASILATALSAATFIGAPQIAYAGNLSYISTNLGGILAILFVAYIIIPACYRNNVVTVYELLDERFGVVTRRAAGIMYMLGRTLAIGARGYIGALPASLIIWGDLNPWHIAIGVIVLTTAGVLYTIVGGIGTVIWTDFVQTCVFVLAAAIAIGILLSRINMPLSAIFHTLAQPVNAEIPGTGSKLTVIDTSLDMNRSFSIWSVLIAFTLLQIGSYGTDQDMIQRMLTCKNAIAGSRSAIYGIIVGIPVTLLFLSIGLLLYIFYARPDIMGHNAPSYRVDDSRKIFLSFILREMPAGLSGLMIAGLFAAGLSSVNSTLNAMSATLIEDFYKPWRANKSEKHYLTMSRFAVVLWGIAIAAVGCLSILWNRAEQSSLLDFALGVMAYAYAGLVAVFLSAFLTKRGNAVSAICAFITGITAVTILQPGVWNALTENIFGKAYTLPLAWPWRFVIATGISFAVCQIGHPRKCTERQP